MTKTTLPAISIETLQTLVEEDTGAVSIKYLKGRPRQYRFDASKGYFNIGGQEPITQTGKPFTLIPIGYRIFKDRLFEYGIREWLELFFIDEMGAISNVTLHGYSVENFMKMSQDLFYENLSIREIEITITPQERSSKANGKKYFIAGFEYKQADKAYLEMVRPLVADMELFRSDTVKPTNEMILWENYPVERVEKEQMNGQN